MSLSLKRVLISDEVDPKCVDILRANGIEVDKNTKLSKEELIAEIPKYDGLIVRSATKVTADVINASNLKIIGRAGTGVDNIDCDAATKKGVIVMNTPGGNTLSAAEHTCTLLLSTSRNISNGTESLRAGRWDRKKFMGNEVNGKTLAIVGLGRIGKEVALRMQSFGMTTIGFDPIISAEEAATFDTEWMELEQIWPRADYITFHTPLIPQTKHMLNDETFAKCKKGVRVLNVARGGIIEEAALLRALQSGQCAGAGLDVFVEEPPKDLSLIQHPNVTSTPHLGASTVEAQSRVAEEIAQQFVDMVQGKSLFGAINANALCNALSPDTAPWVAVGSALGRLAVSIAGPIDASHSIQVITQGDELVKAGSYLGAAALVGLLGSQCQNGLNMVSAPAIAKTMGIKVSAEHDKSQQGAVVTLVVQQPGGVITRLAGFPANGKPTLGAINGNVLSQGTALTGSLIVYQADANSIATIAGAVASAGSNILAFSSTAPSEGKSWSFMQVAPPLAALDALKSNVNFVQQVTF